MVPISFTSDTATKAADRFSIVFEPAATLPVSITSVKAYLKNKGVQIDWTTESESHIDRYEVEKSADAKTFVNIGVSKATNNPVVPATYSFFDMNPNAGDNYYRIKTIDQRGSVKQSEVVRVQIGGQTNAITVVNNPVAGSIIKFLLNNVEKGEYSVSLMNAVGEKIYAGTFFCPGGKVYEQIDLKRVLPGGVYKMVVTKGSFLKNLSILVQ